METDMVRDPAVLFDMDGVLLDSEPVWQAATDAVLARFGMRLDDALAAETAGLDGHEGVRRVLAAHPGVTADADDIKLQIDRAVAARFAAGAPAMPGADELLRHLTNQRVEMALVSTAPVALIASAVQGLGWTSFFRVLLSSEEVGPGKPDPAVYLEALRRLGRDGTAAVAVEDSVNGARAAYAAGLRVIGLASQAAAAQALRAWTGSVQSDLTGVGRCIQSWLDAPTFPLPQSR